MKVSQLLESRRESWHHLDDLCAGLESRRRRKMDSPTIARFAALYRAACADLALAEAYQLPPHLVSYLHRLVGRAHNQLYRSRTFNFAAWRKELLDRVPQRLFMDRCLWLAFALFWGVFLFSMMLAAETKMPLTGRPLVPGYAERVIGEEGERRVQQDFQTPFAERSGDENNMMGCFYLMHNAGIGLQCFALGLAFGIGGLFAVVYNAALIGAVFGYMTRVEHSRDNFFQFVVAHGPFELTAIVLSAAAGMRLGFALVNSRGQTRVGSLLRAREEAMPTIMAAVLLFGMAGVIEAFVSPSGMSSLVYAWERWAPASATAVIAPSKIPFLVKGLVGAISASLLLFYFVLLGWPRTSNATDAAAGAPVEVPI